MTSTEIIEQTIRQSGLKETLRDSLGPFYEPLHKIFWSFWSLDVLRPDHEIYWLYLLSCVTVTLGVFWWRSRPRDFSFNTFVRFLLPRSVYAHKSAIVDYKYYLPNFILDHYFGFGVLIISTPLMGEYCKSLLLHTFGPVESHLKDGLLAGFLYTLLLVVALDMGYFIAHYLEHKIPFFWEFHKVHHSAEVLTPITNHRLHPMDIVVQSFFMNLFTGAVTGMFGYFFYDLPNKITILNVSAIVFVVYFLTASLRHSHVWLSYGWALSHVFYSPAMHQIHHGTAERHVDRNFALFFSFWDYFAGTLYVPREQEVLKLGLTNQEHKEYSSVYTLYVLPFKKAARLVISGIKSWPRSRTVAESRPALSQPGWKPLSDESGQI